MKKMFNIFYTSLVGCALSAAGTSCSDDTYSPDPDKNWAGTTEFFTPTESNAQQTYYNPQIGRCGDPMPLHDQNTGDFKVLYLQEYVNNGPTYHPFWAVATNDGANYRSLGEILPTGSSVMDADAALGTGCAVYSEAEKQYYIYYTGHAFISGSQREVVMRATSPDFKTWTKDYQWTLKGSDYNTTTDFRDPQVFKADDGLWHMVIAGKLKFLDFQSADLKNWEYVGQFNMVWDRMCECPDIFKMGDWWYFIYSEGYRTDWSRKVKYMMAKSFQGLKDCFSDPGAHWPQDGKEGVLDTRAFYAGKTASNGTDRFIWGWTPYRSGADIHEKNINVGAGDGNEPNWSGALVCHKLIQHADGTLSMGAVPAMAAKYGNPQEAKVMASNGYDNGKLSGDDAYVLYSRLGTCNHISFKVTTSNNKDKFGVSFVRSTDPDYYYTLVVNPEEENARKVNFEQEGYRIVEEWSEEEQKMVEKKVYGKGFIEGADGYGFYRPENNEYNIDIYTDNSVLVMYINDIVCCTHRIYGIQKNCWSINNYGGNITISDLKISQQ